MLLDAGASGVPRQKITARLQRYATADDITALLEEWWEDEKVDRYTVENKAARPTTYWRATEKLL
jgi:hypothetical protein